MSLETSYYEDALKDRVALFLTRSLFVFMVINVLLVCFQLYVVYSFVNDCTTIFGLTISGKVFETFSFTCNNPSIPAVY